MSTPAEHNIDSLLEQFSRHFGHSDEPISVFFAPGRVNLIGEYTDFTGGLVFPCAINQGTTLLIRRSYNQQYRFASTNFDFTAQLQQQEISQAHGDNWINYPLGVLDQFTQRGIILDGFDCLYSGNVPNGAGLSSSASIEVVTSFALNQLLQTDISLFDQVRMSQAAENEFVGLQSGIMDQFAVAFAKADHAIMLDCHSLEHRQVPLKLNGLSIVVTNTNQRRELSESAYNDRVSECKRALDILQGATSITHLGELLPDTLKEFKDNFSNDKIPLARAQHISAENARVRAAVPALENGNLQQFGQLMNDSHNSLRDLFNVSSEPLDHLVRLARAQASVLGSRLTGAGFGGCTVTLIPTVDIPQFEQEVGAGYTEATGLSADFYTIHPGEGVRALGKADSV